MLCTRLQLKTVIFSLTELDIPLTGLIPFKIHPPPKTKWMWKYDICACVCVYVCVCVCTCTLSLPEAKSAAAKAENIVAVVFSAASLVRAWVSNVPLTLANIYSPSPLNVYLLPSRVLIWGSPHNHAVILEISIWNSIMHVKDNRYVCVCLWYHMMAYKSRSQQLSSHNALVVHVFFHHFAKETKQRPFYYRLNITS